MAHTVLVEEDMERVAEEDKEEEAVNRREKRR